MISTFFYPKSYLGKDEKLVCGNISALSSITVLHPEEPFYQDGTIYTNTKIFNQIIKECNIDIYTRIIPSMLKRMKTYPMGEIPQDAQQLDKTTCDYTNVYWGLFDTIDRQHISFEKEYEDLYEECLPQIIQPENAGNILPRLYRNLHFTSDAIDEIKGIQDVQKFKTIIKALQPIDAFVDQWASGNFRLSDLKANGVDASDESDTVKDDPKLNRYRFFFVSDDIGHQYCFIHVKIGNQRVYFYPNNEQRQIIIVYVGRHLPTAKYK